MSDAVSKPWRSISDHSVRRYESSDAVAGRIEVADKRYLAASDV